LKSVKGTSGGGTSGACASGDGGCGPEDVEADARCRKCGVLCEGTGDSGIGSIPNCSVLRNGDGPPETMAK
jgi:hypothetical protein